MRNFALTTIAASMALAGCAKSSEDVVAHYQSPVRYQNLSCDQLSGELERVQSHVLQVSEKQDDARTRDQIATGVGIVLFWPALFVLAAGDEKEQLGRLKGEYEALDTMYAQKNCGAASTRIAAAEPPVPVASYAPLPIGTVPPYEGVRLSSYSATDMRWFCGQGWQQRLSPAGRTEYNPCHMPAAFSE